MPAVDRSFMLQGATEVVIRAGSGADVWALHLAKEKRNG
jgi:hypothetical protein